MQIRCKEPRNNCRRRFTNEWCTFALERYRCTTVCMCRARRRAHTHSHERETKVKMCANARWMSGTRSVAHFSPTFTWLCTKIWLYSCQYVCRFDKLSENKRLDLFGMATGPALFRRSLWRAISTKLNLNKLVTFTSNGPTTLSQAFRRSERRGERGGDGVRENKSDWDELDGFGRWNSPEN